MVESTEIKDTAALLKIKTLLRREIHAVSQKRKIESSW
jgi:hypothetical protein